MTLQEARDKIVFAQPEYSVCVSAYAWAHRIFCGQSVYTEYTVSIHDPKWKDRAVFFQAGSDLAALVALACAYKHEADEPVEAVEEGRQP